MKSIFLFNYICNCVKKMNINININIQNFFYAIVTIFILYFYFDIFYYFRSANENIRFFFILSILPTLTYLILGSFIFGFFLQWIIFLNVNPYPLENDNKFNIMKCIPESFRPKQNCLLNECDITKLEYPVVIKPILCSGGAVKVFVIDTLENMIKLIEYNNLDISLFMVQTFLEDYPLEVGILYEKYPWNSTGNILEMIEKTNKNDIKQYDVENSINRNEQITERLNEAIEQISHRIPSFYVGRYDIRFRNLEELLHGQFKVVEVNGTMGMQFSCDALDYNCFLIDFYWVLRRFAIGSYNILTLKGYSPWNLVICMCKSIYSFIKCNDWENLLSLYS